MLPDNILLNLPSSLYVFALAWFPLVTAGLAAVSRQVARIPGFRPADDSRTILMRVLVFLLNGTGLLAFAWQQNLLLDKSMLIAFLFCAAGQTVAGHVTYSGLKNGADSDTTTGAPASGPGVADPSLAAALANATAAATAAEAALKGGK